MKYFKNLDGEFIFAISKGGGNIEITEAEYNAIMQKIRSKPTDPDGYAYQLRADTLEWELVKLPPVEEEPLTDEEALTRYANTLTGASDPDLISAAETLLTERIKEDM